VKNAAEERRKMIKYQKEACTGCRICEVICSMEHTGKINPKQSCIQYQDDWPHIGKVEFCRQCAKKACIQACPTEALSLDDQGLVMIKNDLCTGCLACSSACPFGTLPTFRSHPLFCDTCRGEYQCVKWCPAKALIKVGENHG